MADQNQEVPVIGENNQVGIPPLQADPPIVQNDHYLPNGNLTIYSNYDYATGNTDVKIVPITSVPTLFEVATDERETVLVDTEIMELAPRMYAPHNTLYMPNIAHFIGNIIAGVDIDQKSLEEVMVCSRAYLDGIMEIRESGYFRYLNARRDGLNRRYSKLCMAVYCLISEELYRPQPPKVLADIEIQSIIRDAIQPNITSMRVKLKPYTSNGQDYNVTKSMLSKWLTTTPWHAIIFNSQAPMDIADFIKLFVKIFALYGGKIIRYNMDMPNQIITQGILPNSNYYTNLDPPNSKSYEVSRNTNISLRFVRLIRYLQQIMDDSIQWPIVDNSSDAEDDDNQNDQEQQPPQNDNDNNEDEYND